MNRFLGNGFSCIGAALLAFSPQPTSNHQRIYLPFLPPLSFLCRVVQLVVMCRAKRDCELVADLDAQSSSLRIPHMVGVRG